MKILLAVSGGIDSMYMLHRAPELFPGASFAAAHCNFSLRGAESDGDEAFVRDECRSLGIECFTVRFDTRSYATEHGISIEMAARELRYEWFARLCREHGFEALATAHNANDNAETLILNLLRGSGTKGLRGIPSGGSLKDIPAILRPLLGTSRDDIRKWMNDNGFRWREDSTNSENEARRNKIRNRVFPVFAEINPSFVKTLGEDIERIRQTDDIADDYFRQAAEKITAPLPGAVFTISVPGLLALRHWRYVLWRLLEDCSFNAETFGKLCALLERYRTQEPGTVTLSGKSFQSSSYTLEARKKKLVLLRSLD